MRNGYKPKAHSTNKEWIAVDGFWHKEEEFVSIVDTHNGKVVSITSAQRAGVQCLILNSNPGSCRYVVRSL